jgi:hypothetical protein
MSSHKEPYGGSLKVKTFSDKDYKEWFNQLRISNMDHYSPFCKKPPTPRKLTDQDYL